MRKDESPAGKLSGICGNMGLNCYGLCGIIVMKIYFKITSALQIDLIMQCSMR